MASNQERKPIPAVVSNLAVLPGELAHQVIGELPIHKVLKLTTYDIERLNGHILGHIIYGKIFRSESELQSIRELYTIHHDLHRIAKTSSKVFGPDHSLSKDVQSWLNIHPLAYDFQDPNRVPDPIPITNDDLDTQNRRMREKTTIRSILYFECVDILDGVNTRALERLSQFSASKMTYYWLYKVENNSSLLARWSLIGDAQKNLNTIKAQQLHRLADIFEANSTILKTAEDPDQIVRKNTRHIVNFLRHNGELVMKSNILSNTRYARGIFGRNNLWIVPLDRSLRFVIRSLEKFPPPFATEFQSTTTSQGRAHTYPDYILKDLTTTTAGLHSIYILENYRRPEPIPRVHSKSPGGSHAAFDYICISYRMWSDYDWSINKWDYQMQTRRYRRYRGKTPISPKLQDLHWDEREIEWLESFVRLYRYFEALNANSELMQVNSKEAATENAMSDS